MRKDLSEKIRILENSRSVFDPEIKALLPEPAEDNGYYLIYYPEDLYKSALTDVLLFNADNLRVWYDRRLESGAAWEEYILDKIGEYDCIGAVLYLSDASLRSPFFYRLCAELDKRHKSYCSVNYEFDESGNALSGEYMVQRLGKEIPAAAAELYRKMFSNAITYIRGDAPTEEKIRAIRLIKREDVLVYRIADGEATVISVKDLFVDSVTVPAQAEVDGVKYPVTKIASLAFANCRFLNEIHFPDTLREVGCESFEKIDLGKYRADKLLRLLGGDSVSPIKTDTVGFTFYRCDALEQIILPPSVEKLYARTFWSCENVRHIDFGGAREGVFAALSESPEHAEYDGGNLKRITFSKDILKVDGAFCSKYDFMKIMIPNSVKEIEGYGEFTVSERMVIPEGTAWLNGLFSGNQTIEELTLPSTYAYMSSTEFKNCKNLRRVIFLNDKLEWEDDGEAIFGYGREFFFGCEKLEYVSLPEQIKGIDLNIFTGCGCLKELTLPESVHGFRFLRCSRRYLKKNYPPEEAALREIPPGLETLVFRSSQAFSLIKQILRGGNFNAVLRGKLTLDGQEALWQDTPFIYKLFMKLIGYFAVKRAFDLRSLPNLHTVYVAQDGAAPVIRGFRRTETDREGFYRYERRHMPKRRTKNRR